MLYIPIPVYVTLSVLALSACITNILVNPNINDFHTAVKELLSNHGNLAIVINTIFTLLILFGKLIQYIFFGQLRDIESRNLNDRLMTYVISKLIFIFAAKEPELGPLLVWGFWFSILCCLKLFSLLSRDRFEYLNTFLPNTHAKIHFKLLLLLVGILSANLLWFYFSILVFFNEGVSNLMLLNFECFTIFFETIQTLIKYSIHLFDMSSEGVWDKRGQYIYYTEFSTDSIILAGTCAHLIHIVIIQGFTPTLLHIVLLCYFKMVFTNLNRKIAAYRNYCKLTSTMDNWYLGVSQKDLDNFHDDCAICREKVTLTAKKLPCAHIFHHSCLRAWLEQHHSCPTCRRSLFDDQNQSGTPLATTPVHTAINATSSLVNNNGNSNGNSNNTTTTTTTTAITSRTSRSSSSASSTSRLTQSQINNLQNNANHIHSLFEHIPIELIQADLLITNNVNRTIENILDGKVKDLGQGYQQVKDQQDESDVNSPGVVRIPPPASLEHDSIDIKTATTTNDITGSSSNNNSSSSLESPNRYDKETDISISRKDDQSNISESIESKLNIVHHVTDDDGGGGPSTSINSNSNSNGNGKSNNNNNECNGKPNMTMKNVDKFADSFKNTSEERYMSLQQRKKSMLEASRKQYLDSL
ncbi:hypothetical protein CYY_003752 [Polysphondylium violaceum]|uniref:RING-type domain-containing protein n=1 Tax=Polysphondylium violaceum TaxID=133409 RepID=A0A8J4PYN1_9MYCE|nr:hypothetical protein CYY_003752 [Polysphondylium violaceum]